MNLFLLSSLVVYREGEIIGIAGTSDSGKIELIESIWGNREPVEGAITLNGKELSDLSFKEKMNQIAFIPDSVEEGLNLNFKVHENLASLDYYSKKLSGTLRFYDNVSEEMAKEYVKRLNIDTPGVNTLSRSLSGGNRKKVMVARALNEKYDVVLALEPDSELDLQTKFQVYNEFIKLRNKGSCILFSPEDISDLKLIADKIIVMNKGEIVSSRLPTKISVEEIGRKMLE
ncbi:hypothetical protein AKJ61_03095 [candidate division MSBL1 archaeon SCGC-AAA259B11]|uniref:ABC transporter domain-containing protein n=1 Tax=candidate division MSBL1 archaeon SCGC-AAA259B11 TaxID=1698260 RepID=A0A133U585_9EURY|nr:hypothetical protein AKJ61_03095 [candidate division MSBL1 archaeon SCGC-AAA259B11]